MGVNNLECIAKDEGISDFQKQHWIIGKFVG